MFGKATGISAVKKLSFNQLFALKARKTQLFRNTAGIVPAATQFLSIFCSAERLAANNSSLIQTARLSKRLPVRQLMMISPVRSANRLMRLERVEISIPPGYLPRRG